MKQFACGHVVPGCQRTFRGTQDQILTQVAQHARQDHGLSTVPAGLVSQVIDNIHPVT